GGSFAMAAHTRATPGVYAIERSSRVFSGAFDRISILPPRCSRNVRSDTCSTSTPSSPRAASTIRWRCASSCASTVTSRTFSWPSTRTRSIAPSDPPASPIAEASRANEPGASERRTRSVALKDADGRPGELRSEPPVCCRPRRGSLRLRRPGRFSALPRLEFPDITSVQVMSEYPHLFAAGEIGGVAIRNRIVQPPMGTGLMQDGKVTEREVAFQEERARAGVGLIITGAAIVHPTSRFPVRIIVEAWDEDGIEALRSRCEAVQRHGARNLGQLAHHGCESLGRLRDTVPRVPFAVST